MNIELLIQSISVGLKNVTFLGLILFSSVLRILSLTPDIVFKTFPVSSSNKTNWEIQSLSQVNAHNIFWFIKVADQQFVKSKLVFVLLIVILLLTSKSNIYVGSTINKLLLIAQKVLMLFDEYIFSR